MIEAAGLDDAEGLILRVVVAGLGGLREVEEEWSFDELCAAHRALWLKEQMFQLKVSRFIGSIGKGLKKGTKR